MQGKRRSSRRSFLCFDEWNVWYKAQLPQRVKSETAQPATFAPHLIEEVYNLEDALVVAGFLNSFLRHADVVKVANLAQLVNVIAPILTRGDDLLLQSIYDAFAMYSRRKRGTALRTSVEGPRFKGRQHGETPFLDTAAIRDGETLHLFVTNRDPAAAAEVEIRLAGSEVMGLTSGELLTGKSAKSANSFDTPDEVRARAFDDLRTDNGRARLEMPPLSLVALSLQIG